MRGKATRPHGRPLTPPRPAVSPVGFEADRRGPVALVVVTGRLVVEDIRPSTPTAVSMPRRWSGSGFG